MDGIYIDTDEKKKNIRNKILIESLDPEIGGNRKNIYKAGEGAGKSGSFMFFCHDNQFLIKTMPPGDFASFKKMQQHYFKHVNDYPNSLFGRIYGVYSV